MVFSESNYKGDSFEICNTLSHFPISFNKKIKSYTIGSVERIIFFTETLCYGDQLEDNDDESNMNNNEKKYFVNNIQSVIIDNWERPAKGCIWLYQDECFSEDMVEICEDVSDLKKFRFRNSTSSFKLGEGVKQVIFYTETDFIGQQLKADRDCYSLHKTNYNNKINSVRIIKY
jgi:hypothetical protein